MAIKVGINGFGRIGRMTLRAIMKYDKNKDIDVVAINDLADAKTLAFLLKHDSVYGVLENEITAGDDFISIDGKKIPVTMIKDPAELPWKSMGVEVCVEATGIFRDKEKVQKHIDAGAKKVIVTVPMKGNGADVTIVLGVNEETYDKTKHNIISNASCTTNCLAPIAKVLQDSFGIKNGFMTTVHAYTNDQRIIDFPHKDLRRARAAALNIIPTSTGAAKAMGLVIPELAGKLDGMALRVPTPVGSIVDLVCEFEKETSIEGINAAVKTASQSSKMKGILQYCEDPIVSSDIIGSSYSSIFDSLSTMKVGNLYKVLSWYDNEWGYSTRVSELIKYIVK
ncbi:MAG TPA: type I glyceraldehyde-3-phosphate dehydrogenase [Actinobacteria bacterium]|nr:type I glyceraldehyde-3-phosphate dehydrogenase [Actinomycetota bacterium]